MSTSPAIYSKTQLYIKSGSAEAYINGVTNIGGPNFSKAEIDVTHMGSSAKEYKAAALSDPGTLTFGLQFNPTDATHVYLRDQAYTQGASADLFKILFYDGTNWRFTGSLLSLNITAQDPSQGILTAEASVRLSGAVNFTSGSL